MADVESHTSHANFKKVWSPGGDIHGKQLLEEQLASVGHTQRLHVITFATELREFESGRDDCAVLNTADAITWHMPSQANNPHFSHTCT